MKPWGALAIVGGVIVNLVLVAGLLIVVTLGPWGNRVAKPISTTVFALRPVLEVTAAPCASPPLWVAGTDNTACYRLEEGITSITAVRAEAATGPGGEWVIQVTLSEASGAEFTKLTERLHQLPAPRNQMAILIDGKVISAPAVQEPIPGGVLEISGGFTKDTATELAERLGG